MIERGYSVEERRVEVPVGELIARYRDIDRFVGLCEACGSYGKLWGCPPYGDGYAQRLLDPFTTATIMGTRITFDEENPSKDTVKRAIGEVWDELLPRLYAMEAACPSSRIFTGRCRLCGDEPCARIEDKPCRHPQRVRHSLEAVGFDVVGITRDLLGIEMEWGTGGKMPRHITLVTAHLQ